MSDNPRRVLVRFPVGMLEEIDGLNGGDDSRNEWIVDACKVRILHEKAASLGLRVDGLTKIDGR